MSDSVIDVQWDDRVCNVWLNRPDKLNALDLRVLEGLRTLAQDIEDRPEVCVLVLRGRGRVFSAGADLHYVDNMYEDVERSRHYLDAFRAATLAFETIRVPVVAGIHGMVLAGGLEVMLACDLVVAAESTRIGDQHMSWGFIPGGGSTQRLPRWVGPARARDLLYTGRWIGATEAYEMGLVSRVVADESLDDEVDALANDLADRSPFALARIKELVRRAERVSLDDGLEMEIGAVMEYYRRPEFREAIEQFKNRAIPGNGAQGAMK